MRWPWLSRREHDAILAARDRELAAVAAERDRANTRADRLESALVAIKRRDAGLPELPRQPRAPVERMPADLAAFYSRFADKRMAALGRRAAQQLHADGLSWDAVKEKVLPKKKEGEDGDER